jgi:hypothetical protein
MAPLLLRISFPQRRRFDDIRADIGLDRGDRIEDMGQTGEIWSTKG